MNGSYRWFRLVLVGALAVGGLAATAGPAHAIDDPPCTDATVTKKHTLEDEYHTTYVVVTRLPGGPTGINCTLSPGARNWSVVALQIALNDCFFNNPGALDVDGIYGTDTTNAVRLLQTLEGITADGVYGRTTALHMRWGYRFPGHTATGTPYTCMYHWTTENEDRP